MSNGSCPNCGASDWIETIEHQQVKYLRCGNCKWTPLLDKAETQNASEWLKEMVRKNREAREEYEAATSAYKAKETTLTMGKYNRAKRLWELAEKRLEMAEAISRVIEATPTGQISLLLPEIGLYQFEWGDFNLFRVIGGQSNT